MTPKQFFSAAMVLLAAVLVGIIVGIAFVARQIP